MLSSNSLKISRFNDLHRTQKYQDFKSHVNHGSNNVTKLNFKAHKRN